VTPPGARRDSAAPLVDGILLAHDDSVRSEPGAYNFLPTDTINFEVVAGDSAHLEWLGFRLGGVVTYQDSLPIPEADRQRVVGVTISLLPGGPPLSGLLEIRGFARDSAGNLGESTLANSPASLLGYDDGSYGGATGAGTDFAADLGGAGGGVRLFWIDPARDSIGRSDYDGPSPELPGSPQSLDLTLARDTVVVTLPELGAYGFVDMYEETPTVRQVRDTVTAVPGTPWLIRVGMNDHALVYRRHPTDPAAPGSYVDLDLATGEQRLLAGLEVGGRMERSADRSRIVVSDPATGLAQVYDVATGQVSPPVDIGAGVASPVTMNRDGTLLLAGQTLRSLPALTVVRRFRLPGVIGPTALSLDGLTIFATTPLGILRARASDGMGYDIFPLLGWTGPQIVVMPDERHLVIPRPIDFNGWLRTYIPLAPVPERAGVPALRAAPRGDAMRSRVRMRLLLRP
jgi:hypothetical protein